MAEITNSIIPSPLLGLPGEAVVERIPFVAGDGMALNLVRVRLPGGGGRGPVLLVHGAGVRANIFAAPTPLNFVHYLCEKGYDVWLENWRGSIDIPFNRWTLDQAAVYDHPVAVKTVAEKTGATQFPAVIHCQGSTSFTMALMAGLLPQIKTVVTNAVSLHTVVPKFSKKKLDYAVPFANRFVDHLDPQWGLARKGLMPNLLSALVTIFHHECNNAVCKQVSFTYGTGWPALWQHENLNDETHEWLKGEFGKCPMSFFKQMARCVSAGNLVSLGEHKELPENFNMSMPKTDARIAFFTGKKNLCFLPESQHQSYKFFVRTRSDHTIHELPTYGHLDMFMGKNAANDVFPLMENELSKEV